MKANFDFRKGVLNDSLIDFKDEDELVVTIDGLENEIRLKNVITFPGLINSHDHLEFNLFPFLGNRIYEDYVEWGDDIHVKNSQRIAEVLSISIDLRLKWGIFKNLINGVTTIVHHGRYHDRIKKINYPVILDYQYLHALHTETYWKLKLNIPSGKDVMIHTGEGSGKNSCSEINELLSWNFFNRNLIGVHAISMDSDQSNKFKAIVWCPDSNLRLYGKTARVDLLKHNTKILFGTDSTVSASFNMWEQLRVARNLKLLSDGELYNSLLSAPAEVFRKVKNKSQIIAKRKANHIMDSFFELEPEDLLLIVIHGDIVLADKFYFNLDSDRYTTIHIGNSSKWIVKELASVVLSLEDLGVSLPFSVRSKKDN